MSTKVQLLEFNQAVIFTTYFLAIFFAVLSWLVVTFPGKTNPASIPWIVLLFRCFAFLGIYTGLIMRRTRVVWNDQHFRGADMFGRTSKIAWSELDGVSYVSWAQGYKLIDKKGKTVWVFPNMSGFSKFVQRLNVEIDRLGERVQL